MDPRPFPPRPCPVRVRRLKDGGVGWHRAEDCRGLGRREGFLLSSAPRRSDQLPFARGRHIRYATILFPMRTFLLLLASNIFMTFAWYGQLKLKVFEGRSLWFVILLSWGIAFFEYCLMVPANRIGYAQGLTGYQLKVMQEVITLGVFVVFAWLVLGERLTWNYGVSFLLILGAVYFAVGFKPGTS
jgi:uncharacterized protein (DUF486 family)